MRFADVEFVPCPTLPEEVVRMIELRADLLRVLCGHVTTACVAESVVRYDAVSAVSLRALDRELGFPRRNDWKEGEA